jgi:type IV secretion system protein VirB10
MSRNEVDIDAVEGFDDGRGEFKSGTTKKVPGVRAFIGFLCIVGICLVAWIVWGRIHPPAAPTEDQSKVSARSANNLPRYNFATTSSDAAPSQSAPTAEAQPASSYAQPPAAARAGGGQPAKKEKTPQELAVERRLTAMTTSSQSSAQSAGSAATGKDGRRPGGIETSSDSSALANKMTSAKMPVAVASVMKNPSMTMAAGTMIPCGTITELDTTVPGFVSCQVSREVRSADGSVVLVDPGAKVTGEMSGGIMQGQARVFVLWSRVRNRDGVVAYIDAPGTNRLGSTGIPGQVDNHWNERIGQALLVSVLSDASKGIFQMLANSTQSSGNTSVNLGNTSNTSDSMSREVLRSTLNIPPTLFDYHGDSVSIFVPRDIDFSKVYGLEMAQ